MRKKAEILKFKYNNKKFCEHKEKRKRVNKFIR